jgi:hypothetical protein
MSETRQVPAVNHLIPRTGGPFMADCDYNCAFTNPVSALVLVRSERIGG